MYITAFFFVLTTFSFGGGIAFTLHGKSEIERLGALITPTEQDTKDLDRAHKNVYLGKILFPIGFLLFLYTCYRIGTSIIAA